MPYSLFPLLKAQATKNSTILQEILSSSSVLSSSARMRTKIIDSNRIIIIHQRMNGRNGYKGDCTLCLYIIGPSMLIF